MFASVAEKILNRVFGNYLDGIDRNSASLGIRSGDLRLRYVEIKPIVADILNLPVKLLSGRIGSLRVGIQWTKLGSTPIVIELDTVDIALKTVPDSEWSEEREIAKLKAMREKIAETIDIQVEFAMTDTDASQKQGIMSSIGSRLLQFVELKINELHLRVHTHDDVTIGLTLGSLVVSSGSSSGADFSKSLTIESLAAYLNPDDFSDRQILMNPVSGKLQLIQSAISSGHSYTVTGKLPQLDLEISEAQFRSFRSLQDVFGCYSIFALAIKNKIRKFQVWKPSGRPTGRAREWWRWAVFCVTLDRQDSKCAFSKMNIRKLRLREEYRSLLSSKSERLADLEISLELDDMVRWRSEFAFERGPNKLPTPGGISAWLWGAAKPSTPSHPREIDLPRRSALVAVDLELTSSSLTLTSGAESSLAGEFSGGRISVRFDNSDKYSLAEWSVSCSLKDAKVSSKRGLKSLVILRRESAGFTDLLNVHVVAGTRAAIEISGEKLFLVWDPSVLSELRAFFSSAALPDISAASTAMHAFYMQRERQRYRVAAKIRAPTILLPVRPRSLRGAISANLGTLAVDSVDQPNLELLEFSFAMRGLALDCSKVEILTPLDLNLGLTIERLSNSVSVSGRFLEALQLILTEKTYASLIRAGRLSTNSVSVSGPSIDATFDVHIPSATLNILDSSLSLHSVEFAGNFNSLTLRPKRFSIASAAVPIIWSDGPEFSLTGKKITFEFDILQVAFSPLPVKRLIAFLKNNIPEESAEMRVLRPLGSARDSIFTWGMVFKWGVINVDWIGQDAKSSTLATVTEISFFENDTFLVESKCHGLILSPVNLSPVNLSPSNLSTTGDSAALVSLITSVPLHISCFSQNLVNAEHLTITATVPGMKMNFLKSPVLRFWEFIFAEILPAISGDLPPSEDAEDAFISAGESDDEVAEILEDSQVQKLKRLRIANDSARLRSYSLHAQVAKSVVEVPVKSGDRNSLTLELGVGKIWNKNTTGVDAVIFNFDEINAFCDDAEISRNLSVQFELRRVPGRPEMIFLFGGPINAKLEKRQFQILRNVVAQNLAAPGAAAQGAAFISVALPQANFALVKENVHEIVHFSEIRVEQVSAKILANGPVTNVDLAISGLGISDKLSDPNFRDICNGTIKIDFSSTENSRNLEIVNSDFSLILSVPIIIDFIEFSAMPASPSAQVSLPLALAVRMDGLRVIFPERSPRTALGGRAPQLRVAKLNVAGEVTAAISQIKASFAAASIHEGAFIMSDGFDFFLALSIEGSARSLKANLEPMSASLSYDLCRLIGRCASWQADAARHLQAEDIGQVYVRDNLELLIHSAKVTVLRDSTKGDRFTPVLEIETRGLQFTSSGIFQSSQSFRESKSITGEISAKFFNPAAAAWEPVAEGSAGNQFFSFRMRQARSNAQSVWLVDSEDSVTITVTEEFLVALIAAEWQAPPDPLKPNFAHFSVSNLTGEPIAVQSQENSTLALTLQPGEEERLEQITASAKFISVSGARWSVGRVALTRPGIFPLLPAQASNTFEGEATAEKCIFTSLEIAKDGRRVLCLTSGVVIVNALNRDLRIFMRSESGVTAPHAFSLGPEKMQGLPVALLSDCVLNFEISDSSRSSPIFLSNLSKSGRPFLVACAAARGGAVFMNISAEPVIVKTRDVYAKQLRLVITPPLRLSSALPLPLGYHVTATDSSGDVSSAATGELALNKSVDIISVSVESRVFLQLRIFGNLWSSKMQIWPVMQNGPLVLTDTEGRFLEISVTRRSRSSCPIDLLLHADGWLLRSDLPSMRYLLNDDERPLAIGGLPGGYPVPLSATDKKLTLQSGELKSSAVAIDVLGLTGICSIKREDGFVQDYAVRVSSSSDIAPAVRARMVAVRQRFCIVNQSDKILKIRTHATAEIVTVSTFARAVLPWWAGSSRNFQVRLDADGWEWSGWINAEEVGEIECLVFNKSQGYFMNLRVDVRPFRGVSYLVISRTNESTWAVRNSLTFPLWVKQANTTAHFVPLLANQTLSFAWFEPAKPKVLEFLFDTATRSGASATFGDPGANGTLAVVRKGHQPSQAPYFITLEGCTSVFIVSENVAPPMAPIKADSAFRFDFAALSVSLVAGKPRGESLLLTLQNLSGQLSSGKDTREVRLKIGNVQLDDMRTDSAYPVIFESFDKNQPSVEFSGVLSTAGGQSIYRRIFLNLCKSRVAIDASSITALIAAYRAVVARANQGPPTAVDWATLDSLDLETDADRPLIESVTINAVKLALSFSPGDAPPTAADTSLVQKIISGMSSIENSPVKMRTFQFKGSRASLTAAVTVLVEHYKHELYRSMRSLIGSAEAFGNPIGLYSNISTGVQDLFAEPLNALSSIDGRVEDFALVADGTARGAKSFVMNTTFGVFNSVSKLAETSAKTLAVLSQDDDFSSDRSQFRRKNRPTDLGEGLAAGAAAFGSGLLSGISGLVMKPVQGFEQEGIEGLAKGAVQGVSGLVLKPLSGFFDFATSTAEGVASSARVQVSSRQRAPRMTYGESRTVKNFQPEHAFLNSYFGEIPGLPEFVNFIDYTFDYAKALVLVLTTEHVFVIDAQDKFLQARVSLWRILAASVTQYSLELVIIPRSSSESSTIDLHFSTVDLCNAAHALVQRGLSEF